MPPRARNIDDSRSETSSTVTNQKEKALLGAHTSSSSGVSKGRRTAAANAHGAGGSSNRSAAANGGASAAAATATSAPAGTEKEGNLPKTDWNTVPPSILRTYRVAHRLPVPSTLNHPHADLTYNSSPVALRAPSAVQARRRLREQKHQRRKSNLQQQTNGTTNGKNGGNSRSKGADRGGKDVAMTSGPGNEAMPDRTSDEQASPTLSGSAAATTTPFLGPREPPSHLANSVRKHFNAQQLSEADTVARFIYVVQQNGRTVRTEGSAGDGTGHWMGSHGRQVRRIDGPGGEVGFRLRFRP